MAYIVVPRQVNVDEVTIETNTLGEIKVKDLGVGFVQLDPNIMPLAIYTGTYSSTEDDTKITGVVSSVVRQGFYIQNVSSAGVTNDLNFDFNLPLGNFSIIVEYSKQNGGGKFDVELDGVKQGATVDTYASSNTYNQILRRDIVVSEAGKKVLNLKNLGIKNGSSNNYVNMIQEVRFVRND